VAAAFDEVRFGRGNTLDLRSGLPSGPEATRRAEAFLRERQVAQSREVLVITGRGNQSEGGVAVVRPAVAGALAKLRRLGVVEGWQEHTPGSFVVTPAPITALFEAPRRHGEPSAIVVMDDKVFAGLAEETRVALRALAIRSLQALGAPADEPFVRDEMQRQFSVLGKSIPPEPGRDAKLRIAAEAAIEELDAAE
jgi:hypothetical protein